MTPSVKRVVLMSVASSCLLLLCTSCTFHKTAVITSSPPGADVFIDGNFAGKTPYTVTFLLNNKLFTAYEPVESPKQIKVEAAGYEAVVKVYNRIDRTSEVPRYLTHFELKPSHGGAVQEHTLSAPPSAPPPVQYGKGLVTWRNATRTRALVVGITEYRDAGLPKVRNGTSDATAMSTFLRSAGIPAAQITTLTDSAATRNEIVDGLRRLKTGTMEPSDMAVFYFSGHGAPIVEGGKAVDGVLVPHDAKESSLADTSIPLDKIRELLSEVRGNWVVILDACFSGKPGRSVMPSNVKGLVIVPAETKTASPPASVWWLTATSGQNYANDLPDGTNGVFTHYLLRALQGGGDRSVDDNGDGLISLREAFYWTRTQVREVSARSLGRQQVPELLGGGDTIITVPR